MPSSNKPSILLTTEENNLIFSLLGTGCLSLATTVVQRFTANGKSRTNSWILANSGVICFVRDIKHRSFYFRIYCPNMKTLIWEQELYNFMEYLKLTEYLHSFESEDCITGFNFANEDEADMLYDLVIAKLEHRKPKPLRSLSNTAEINKTPHIKTTNNEEKPKVYFNFNRRTNKDKTNKKKITKDLIGKPQDFRHISHYGFDSTPNFNDIDDDTLNLFFNKAGVSESQLKDPSTQQFILNFIDKNGGMEAVKIEVNTSTPRASQYQYDLVENISFTPCQPSPSTPLQAKTPPSPSTTSFFVPLIPPPQPNIPPPPPPRSNIPIPQPPPLAVPPLQQQGDPRSNLMEAIRSGATLKHVSASNGKNNATTRDEIKPEINVDSRHNLLDEIRHGVKLHAVPKVDEHDQKHTPIRGGLAAALADALNQRALAIQSNSDEYTSESSDGEEWDDD